MTSPVTPDMVRLYISDTAEDNLLLDKQEFSDDFINLCQTLALSEFNNTTPITSWSIDNFPFISILLLGTVWQMYQGRAALMARNQLSYTDGGLQVPVEERFELYTNLAATYKSLFFESAAKLKLGSNLDCGWGSVSTDEAFFPIW